MNHTFKGQESNILDESILSKPRTANASELILVGVLGYVSLNSTLWTIDYLIKDVFIYFNMIPVVNFWIREILYSVLFIFIFLLFFNQTINITLSKKKTRKYFIWLIVIYISSQILQMIHGFYQFDIFPDPYLDRASYYYREMKNRPLMDIVRPIFTYFRYFFIILLIIYHPKESKIHSINNH